MRLPRRILLLVLFAAGVPAAALAGDPKAEPATAQSPAAAPASGPKAELVVAQKAIMEAPAWRLRGNLTNLRDGTTTDILVECVPPDRMRARIVTGSKKIEIFTDGKKAIALDEDGKPQELPAEGVQSNLETMRQSFTFASVPKQATDVQVAGHETLYGTPTTILAITVEDEENAKRELSKMWVSNTDHRVMRVEAEGSTKDQTAPGGYSPDTKTVMTYDYDPAIKVVLPGK